MGSLLYFMEQGLFCMNFCCWLLFCTSSSFTSISRSRSQNHQNTYLHFSSFSWVRSSALFTLVQTFSSTVEPCSTSTRNLIPLIKPNFPKPSLRTDLLFLKLFSLSMQQFTPLHFMKTKRKFERRKFLSFRLMCFTECLKGIQSCKTRIYCI